MTFDREPLAVLGLAPGATPAEVKRAYRRLAKVFHPDAAGVDAMPRFLGIQAAYERLTGQAPGPMPGPGGTPGRGDPGASSWQSDADRARTARDGWRARGPRRAGSTSTGPGGAGERRAGDAGPRPAGARGNRGTGTRGGAGAGGAPGASGAGAADETAGERRQRRAEARRRATPGSTSYDGVDQEPFDPEWSGASWYGQTSGTYWTINPKEYADPRKHGPEYQARARRKPGHDDAPPADADPVAPPEPEAAKPRGWTFPPDAEAEADARTAFRPRRSSGDIPREPGSATAGAGNSADWSRDPGDRQPVGADERWDPFTPGIPVVALPRGGGMRLALAMLGWPPLGLGLAWLIGEVSGCSRFAASCSPGEVGAFALGTWVAQLAVLGLLALLPAVAAISALGTIGMLATAVPAAVLLSVGGGGYRPEAAGAALAVLLAAGYVGGVVFAILRRSRTIAQ